MLIKSFCSVSFYLESTQIVSNFEHPQAFDDPKMRNQVICLSVVDSPHSQTTLPFSAILNYLVYTKLIFDLFRHPSCSPASTCEYIVSHLFTPNTDLKHLSFFCISYLITLFVYPINLSKEFLLVILT